MSVSSDPWVEDLICNAMVPEDKVYWWDRGGCVGLLSYGGSIKRMAQNFSPLGLEQETGCVNS